MEDLDVNPGTNMSGTTDGIDKTVDSRSFIAKTKEQAREAARKKVSAGTSSASAVIGSLAQSLVTSGEQLREQQNQAAPLIEKAAEKLQSMAESIEGVEPAELVRKTENWARRNPALFVAAAFAVGIVGARFLKSSAPIQSGIGGSATSFSDREIPTPIVEE